MYIRRKVFSVAYDEVTGEEKLFSTTEILSEDAYMEKLYAEVEEEEKKNRIKGSAIGAGVAATGVGVGAAGAYGLKKGGEYFGKVANKRSDKIVRKVMQEADLKKKDALRGSLKRSQNLEKGLAAIQKGGASATRWVKSNPKLAASIAAAGVAAGAATGAAIGKKE